VIDLEAHKVDITEQTIGDWSVELYEVSEEMEKFQSLRCAVNPQRPYRVVRHDCMCGNVR